MLSTKEINERYEELVKRKNQLAEVETTVQKVCRDLSITISKNDVPALERLLEQTGQYKLLKRNYIATYETFVNSLRNAGFSDNAVYYMTMGLSYENIRKN